MTYPPATPPFKGLGPTPKPPITFPAIFPEADLAPFHKIMSEMVRQLSNPPRPLLPKKEEPMNTAPRYEFTDADGDRILIQNRHRTVPDEAHVAAKDGVFIPRDEAPAAALALLEAAGWTTGPHGFAKAVEILRDGVKAREERKLTAAKLDAEALKLFNAATESGFREFPNDTVRETWRRAARRARELHSGKPEAPAPAPKPEKPRFALVEYIRGEKREHGFGILDRRTGRVAPFGENLETARNGFQSNPLGFIYDTNPTYKITKELS